MIATESADGLAVSAGCYVCMSGVTHDRANCLSCGGLADNNCAIWQKDPGGDSGQGLFVRQKKRIMEAMPKMRKSLFYGLGALQVFIGLGAVAGGLGLVLDPSGASVGTPLALLAETPFTTFLIPGIVLFVVNGLGSLAGAIVSFTRQRYAGEGAIALGVFLIAWILVQVYWMAGFHWLHWLYLMLGLVEVVLGWLVRRET